MNRHRPMPRMSWDQHTRPASCRHCRTYTRYRTHTGLPAHPSCEQYHRRTADQRVYGVMPV